MSDDELAAMLAEKYSVPMAVLSTGIHTGGINTLHLYGIIEDVRKHIAAEIVGGK